MNDMTQSTMPETITIGRPTTEMREVSGLLAQAHAFQVIDDDTSEIAAEEIKAIKAKREVVEDERLKITKPLFEAKKAADALFKKLSDPLDEAERVLKGKLIGYQTEQDRVRRAAQAKAEEQARAERERLEREAARAEKKGKVEEAAAKRDIAAAMPTTFVAPPTPKPQGMAIRKNWKCRTKGPNWKRELIAFIAGVPVEKLAHPQFEYLLDLNETKAHQLAKQHETIDLGIPGLEGFNDAVASIR